MAKDTELENDTGVEDGGSFAGSDNDTSNDEPKTKTFDRESFVSDTFAEGAEEAVLEGLAGKENITLDDLRQIPGAEGMTDEQLTAAWDKAVKEAGGPGAEGLAAGDQKVELPFPVYDEKGNKIASDKVTLSDLLSGKALVGYNAMGKEQRKSLNDVLRNASQGHWNEHRYNSVQSQYRQAAEKLATLEKESTGFKEMQSQWNSALTALLTGNNAPMKALVDAYRSELTKSGQAPPQGFVSEDAVAQERANAESGMQWWTDVGLPTAYEIANTYGADAKEVQGAIQYFISNEPNLTPQRIEEILKFDVPYEFEKNGYTAKSGVESGTRTGGQPQADGSGTQPNAELVALQKQVEALTQRLAGTSNERTNAVRTKNKNTPPAGSGVVAGAGDSMPAFKNRGQMKEWLQS